jgi:hypothetical protein
MVLACKSGYSGPLRLSLSCHAKAMVQQIGFARWLYDGGIHPSSLLQRAYFSCSALNQNNKTNNNTKDSRKVTPSGTLESHKAKMMK